MSLEDYEAYLASYGIRGELEEKETAMFWEARCYGCIELESKCDE